MEYTEAEILEQGLLYQSILDVLKRKPYAMSAEEIADETGLDETEVQRALKELDEVRCVAGDLYTVLVSGEPALFYEYDPFEG